MGSAAPPLRQDGPWCGCRTITELGRGCCYMYLCIHACTYACMHVNGVGRMEVRTSILYVFASVIVSKMRNLERLDENTRGHRLKHWSIEKPFSCWNGNDLLCIFQSMSRMCDGTVMHAADIGRLFRISFRSRWPASNKTVHECKSAAWRGWQFLRILRFNETTNICNTPRSTSGWATACSPLWPLARHWQTQVSAPHSRGGTSCRPLSDGWRPACVIRTSRLWAAARRPSQRPPAMRCRQMVRKRRISRE